MAMILLPENNIIQSACMQILRIYIIFCEKNVQVIALYIYTGLYYMTGAAWPIIANFNSQ